jgi:hypothetical protein
MFQYISMCLNVFIDIAIGISPSHTHCNVFAMHIHIHNFFFTLYNDSPPNMLYYYTFFFLPFPLIRSNFHTIYEKITYQSLLFTSIHHPTIPHSMLSLIVRSMVEPKFFFLQVTPCTQKSTTLNYTEKLKLTVRIDSTTLL